LLLGWRKLVEKYPVSMGVEVEFFTISTPRYKITRKIVQPHRQVAEKGERFTRDRSIGTEYDSRVFSTVREAFFLLKSGLRKFILKHYRYSRQTRVASIAFLGGWRDRFAGSHFHIALGPSGIQKRHAAKLAKHIHDHIPFLIVLCANSPVWRGKINKYASNRLLLGGEEYCYAVERGTFDRDHYKEISYNYAQKSKPPTLELRVCDSNIPEYLCAALVVLKAITLACLRGRRIPNPCTHENYLLARENAIKKGVNATLYWKDRKISVPKYVDSFFRHYRREIEDMDIPYEILDIFKLLKLGFNGAEILRRSCNSYRRNYPDTWKRHFGKNYATAVEKLLDGETLRVFAKQLDVKLPEIDSVRLG
jgi:gamma-glutamyl:cysteine ligase YbdK (ATP-grasp superfamily)